MFRIALKFYPKLWIVQIKPRRIGDIMKTICRRHWHGIVDSEIVLDEWHQNIPQNEDGHNAMLEYMQALDSDDLIQV